MAIWLDKITKPSPTNERPGKQEQLRNDLLVAAVVLFALFLGVGIRNQVLTAAKPAHLGDDFPALAYPAAWRAQGDDQHLFVATRPGSPSTFDTRLEVSARPLDVSESLEKARAGRALQLVTTLDGYRELASEEMRVYRDQPALVTTYAYIADPTLDSGASGLPVVVEAQDVLFLNGGQVMVVTVAADAADWEAQQQEFDIIFRSMKLQPPAEAASTTAATATPAATGEAGDGMGDVVAPTAVPDSFGSGQQGQEEGGN